jgi:hypothetical protein
MSIFTPFLECRSTSKCSKFIYCLGGNNYSNVVARTWSLKAEQGVIKVATQIPDGSPIEPKGILSKWRNDCGVLTMEKYKITWSDWGVVQVNEK